jgi:hypothetical protein
MKVAIYMRRNRPVGERPTIEEQVNILNKKSSLLGFSKKEYNKELFSIFTGKTEYNKYSNYLLTRKKK